MLVSKNPGNKRKIQNSKFPLKLYSSINDRSNLLHLKAGYQMYPSAVEIFQRRFMINDLAIRYQNTEVLWKGAIDLRYLQAPLSEIVDLGSTHIEVYPKQQEKPMAGKELNRTCFVTFSKFNSVNTKKLRRICQNSECEVLAMDLQHKQFTVQIKHFTKYSFAEAINQNDSDNGQQQQRSLQIVGQQPRHPSLVNNLRQNHARSIVRQNQMIRTGAVIPPVQIKRNILPNTKQQAEIKDYNIKKGHQIDGERIKGAVQTIGINCLPNSVINSTSVHFVMFNKLPEQRRDLYNIVIDIMKDEASINKYICEPRTPFKVKRILTLNVIAFDFQKCYFAFEKDSNDKLQLVRIEHAPDNYYQAKYFKDWFEWVANQSEQLNSIQNKFLKALALRKGYKLVENCLQFNQRDDSQFLSSIEDQAYRLEDPPRNLRRQLRAISLGDMSLFSNMSWLYKLGVYFWYYSFKSQSNETLMSILKQPVEQHQDFNIERHILLNFFSQAFMPQNLTPISESDYALLWLICNKNNDLQKQLNKQTVALQKYNKFRFDLLFELTQIYADSNISLELVSYDRQVSKQNKTRVIEDFIKKYSVQAERLPISEWKQYTNLINQNKAINYYANNQFFMALQLFGKCTTYSAQAERIIKLIAKKEQILTSFYPKSMQKAKRLLEGVDHLPKQNLKSQIMFINMALGKQQLTKSKVLALINLCYEIRREVRRKRMLEVLFREMIKSPIIISQLKKNTKQLLDSQIAKQKQQAEKASKSQNKPPTQKVSPPKYQPEAFSFYQRVSRVFVDPSYQLELKLARLTI